MTDSQSAEKLCRVPDLVQMYTYTPGPNIGSNTTEEGKRGNGAKKYMAAGMTTCLWLFTWLN